MYKCIICADPYILSIYSPPWSPWSPKRLAHVGVDCLCHASRLGTLGPLHILRKGQLLGLPNWLSAAGCHNLNFQLTLLQTAFHHSICLSWKKMEKSIKIIMKYHEIL